MNGKVDCKILILLKMKHAYLCVSAVIFCKKFFAYTVHIELLMVCFLKQSINIHVGPNIYPCQRHARLCFEKFARSNLHSLRRHRGCIVVPSRADI